MILVLLKSHKIMVMVMSLKITYLIHQIAKGGGMALQAINMADSLARKGHDISMIFASKFHGANWNYVNLYKNIKFSEITIPVGYYPPFFQIITNSIFMKKKQNTDIVQCFNPLFDAIAAINIKRQRKIPVVIRVGSIYENFYSDKLYLIINGKIIKSSNIVNSSIKITIKMILEKCDVIVFNSNYLKDYYKNIKNPNKLVIRNGIDLSKFKHLKNFPVHDGSKYMHLKEISTRKILYVGRIEPRKSLETLILALSYLPASLRREVTLILIGSTKIAPKYYEFLQNFIKKKSLSDQVFFLGYIDYKDLPIFYALSDLVVFTSDFQNHKTSEGLPNVILEALACQCPCIAADIAGVREVITDMNNGILFHPNDVKNLSEKISLVLNDKMLAKRLSSRARNSIVNNHSLEYVTSRYEAIYKLCSDK
ncbi:MAG: glycosyltransferase family 1 protein [Candidatus Lokiarchaeota archaeon]|nr:glycosyltransferase family 1 protein [Candidatus Lokiarchaeota archaeon]